MTVRERFTDEEWALIAHVPFDAFLFGALADGEVEEDEVNAFTETLRRAADLKDPIHREIALYWAAEGMAGQGEELAFQLSESGSAMQDRMAKTKGVLQEKLTRQEYQGLFQSVWLNAMDVASRSKEKKGHWWNRKEEAISDAEAKALATFAATWEIDLPGLARRTS